MLALVLYAFFIRRKYIYQHRVRAVVLLSIVWAFGDASLLDGKQLAPHFFYIHIHHNAGLVGRECQQRKHLLTTKL